MIKRPLFLAAFLCTAIFLILLFILKIDFFPKMPEEGTKITISGKLYKIEKKSFGLNYFIKTKEYGKVILSIAAMESEKIRIGNTLQTDICYEAFSCARNYGNFDEKNYYHSLGISMKLSVNSIESVIIIDSNYSVIFDGLYRLNCYLTEIINKIVSIDQDKAAVISSMLTGDRSGISIDTKELYKNNGISHILAISGLHISFLGMGLYELLRKKLSIPTSGIISALFLILYCILCGAGVSAIRATGMFIIRLIGIYKGKKYDLMSSFSCLLIILLITNPYFIQNSAFLLSFGAILAVCLVPKPVSGFLSDGFHCESGIINIFVSGFSVSVFMLPFIASIYYEITLYSLLINMIVIPLMSFILGGSIFGTVIGIFNILFGRLTMGLSVFLLYFIDYICFFFSFLPMSIIVCGYPGAIKIFFFYLLLFLLLLVLRHIGPLSPGPLKMKRKVFRIFGICAIYVFLILLLCIKFPQNDLQISFFDVGQGDCTLIKSPSGKYYLIDGGSSSVKNVGQNRIESALKHKGVGEIDYVIITHPDTDHISGLIEFLEDESSGQIKINTILLPKIINNQNYEQIINLANNKSVNVQNIHSGMKIEDGNLLFECIHPSETYTSENANGYSAVLSVSFGDFDALFTGDIEKDEEAHILNDSKFVKLCNEKQYELLKIAHHGSKNSSTESFLSNVNPDYAIIFAGENNSYGHPNEEVLNRIKKIGSAVYCTKDCGEIDIIAKKTGKVYLQTKI